MSTVASGSRLFQAYPFGAIVGQEAMKRALLAAVVNPTLHGVLIRGERGTAKSTAARALTRLLPEQNVVAGCRFGCDPDAPGGACDECHARHAAGETLPRAVRRVPFVSLPVSATEDRVVGTLDLERAVLRGEQRFSPGVLAEAHRGVLYVDEVNLLPDHVMDLLLDAAAMGVNLVEREGIAVRHPSRFLLVGTMNPEEGELRPQLTDRFDLSVIVEGERDPKRRREILERRLAYEEDPAAFVEAHAAEEERLAAQVAAAKARLPEVPIPGWAKDEACAAATELGVDGHRAELATLKAVAALAALEGGEVSPALLTEALSYAFGHRLRRRPLEEGSDGEAKLGQVLDRVKQLSPPRPSAPPSPGPPPGKKNT